MNAAKHRAISKFTYSRILGHQPLVNGPDVDAWNDALGTFVAVFGPPEIDARENRVVVFWNFIDLDSEAPGYFSCYASVPAHRRLTASLPIDVAIAGGRGAKEFAYSFQGRHVDTEVGECNPAFFISKGPIHTIQNSAKAHKRLAAHA